MLVLLFQDGQTKLESLTSGTLESVSKGHQTLMAEQEKLRSTQQSVHDFVALNLRELTREKALIAAGQRELSLMTKEVKMKLGSFEEFMILFLILSFIYN